MATSKHTETDLPLMKANKKIADLRVDIHRLSEELKRKSDMLIAMQDLAHEQSQRIFSLSAALQDTVHWDPSTCPRPSCSTPSHQRSWAEVVHGGKVASDSNISPPHLTLSNRFEALSQPGLNPDFRDAVASSRLAGAAPAAPGSGGPGCPSPPTGSAAPAS